MAVRLDAVGLEMLQLSFLKLQQLQQIKPVSY